MVAGLVVATVLFWQGQRSDAALNQLRIELQSQSASESVEVQARPEPEAQPVQTIAASPAAEIEQSPQSSLPVNQEPGEAFILNDRSGSRIGRLLGVDVLGARYQAATMSGYLFAVNVRGAGGNRPADPLLRGGELCG